MFGSKLIHVRGPWRSSWYLLSSLAAPGVVVMPVPDSTRDNSYRHNEFSMAPNCALWLSVRSWWRHQMETFSAYLAFCAGNSPAPVNSSHKGRWRRALVFSFIYAWINDWVNNREAGDLRCHRGHCDVDVMILQASFTRNTWNAVYGLLQTNLHSSAVLWENIQGSYLLFWQ